MNKNDGEIETKSIKLILEVKKTISLIKKLHFLIHVFFIPKRIFFFFIYKNVVF